MAADHQKANEQLKKIAAAKGINLPADMSSSDRREFDNLQKKSGADFDREYMKEMVSDHKKDVKEFHRRPSPRTILTLRISLRPRCRHCSSIWTWRSKRKQRPRTSATPKPVRLSKP
jgi:hypothetical protein